MFDFSIGQAGAIVVAMGCQAQYVTVGYRITLPTKCGSYLSELSS